MRSSAALLALRLKLIIVLLTPFAAMAAEEKMHALDPSAIPMWTWFFILLFANAGWVVAELDKMADALVPELSRIQKVKEWLKFIKSWVASNLAGISLYFLAKAVPQWVGLQADAPEMVIFVGISIAGYSGVQFLNWIRTKFFPATKQE